MGSSKFNDTGLALPGSAEGGVREALVTLHRSRNKSSEPLTPQAVETLVGQVCRQTGLRGEVEAVLSSLRSFRIRAPERFLKALADAPIVATVRALESSGSAKIQPVDRRPIDLPD